MSVLDVAKDPSNLTMTMTCEFQASPESVWQLWADPRKLERWWGPPEWPATFHVHDLRPGGRAEFYMTGPDGERSSRRATSSYATVSPMKAGRATTTCRLSPCA